MKKSTYAVFTVLTLMIGLAQNSIYARDLNHALAKGFDHPPPDARPWVYWFWLNGNITSNGITADLEAMKRVGIGGVLIMEVDQGAPVGPADFMSQRWRDLFKHVHNEARRLGLEVNMNDDAGWNGSGGPWIKPEQSMQEVVWTETNLAGPQHFEGTLAQPEATAGFYRDITVQAFPTVGDYRIPDIERKAAFQKRGRHKPSKGASAPDSILGRNALTNLTPRMDASGKLVWDVPPGNWTVIRFGHTSTGVENSPAPKSGRGLECDKLRKEGIEANFAGMMARLAADNKLKTGNQKPGLIATHIDSWENGTQNWTAKMREEFQRRRGYDLFPFLPVFTGRVIGSLEISERFLWDLRQTISELVIENYGGHFRELAHAAGMRFTCEAYGAPCDAIPYGGQCDEPMGEFWTPSGAIETCKAMASAGHVYGKTIIGAESSTSADQEKWREHPATLKSHGDRAFCEGINRFVFHRYALQPWTPERRPGMMMGPWGQHYERTQTWWEWTPAWHEYLARCQFMLRQGLFVADICYVQPEAPPQGPGDHKRGGYAWDGCTAHEVITRMSVKDGRIVLPDGMSYRVLALPWPQTMTPALLRKVKELVQAGATVLGPKPSASPGLSGYPQCDEEVKQLAQELWSDGVMEKWSDEKKRVRPLDSTLQHSNTPTLHRVIVSDSPEKVLAESGVSADFTSGQTLRFIHRTTGSAEIYFVANPQPHEFTTTCSFRVTGKIPELWWPDSGRIERAAMWQEQDGVTHVVVPFEPSGSVFVAFRERTSKSDPVVLVKRDGKAVLSAAPEPRLKIVVTKARYGVPDDPQRTRDVTQKVQRKADTGEFSFPVTTMAEGDDPAFKVEKTLVVDYTIDGKPYTVQARDPETIHLTREAVQVKVEKARYGVLDDPQRTRDVREKLQRLVDAGVSSFVVARMAEGDDPAVLVVKTLKLDATVNGERRHFTGTDPDTINLAPEIIPPRSTLAVRSGNNGGVRLETREPGEYELVSALGKTRHVTISAAPPVVDVSGPWQVRFAPGWGAPAQVFFDKLISWSEHSELGVKYFSGEAIYSKTLIVPSEMLGKGKELSLDLGRVAIMAEVKLNGRNLGTLWKPPFVVNITDAAKAGANKLEVRVVNLWPNRLIGDEQLPEDSERNPDGTLKKWPDWLEQGKPSPAGRFTFAMWRLWKKNDALLESGLIGPVRLVAVPTAVLK
ncbi:MAG: hypothetical protein HY298_21515 [Verrucomicrobia bacterium]|nr:hypothetical protein [Verrucomicrobiota bacterium]